MSISEAHALSELAAAEALTQRELGERLRLEKSTVSRLADQLADRGLVERSKNPDDGRSFRLRLTRKGRQLAGRLRNARSEMFAELIENMSARDRTLVVRGLTR